MKLYPLKLSSIRKEYIWGTESWDVTNREEDISIITNGHFAGLSIQQLSERFSDNLLGHGGKNSKNGFPLLLKTIHANDWLSVQVHPSGDSGKTEAWYVLSATADAKIVFGLAGGVDYIRFSQSVQEKRIEETLNIMDVKAGDFFYIPGGKIHALGAGIKLLEIQQNSNTTYRLYDWGRIGIDGKPRQLHIEEALSSIIFDDCDLSSLPTQEKQAGGSTIKTLLECPYFTIEKVTIHSHYEHLLDGGCFEVLSSVDGNMILIYDNNKEIYINPCETLFLPASIGQYRIVGQGELLKTYCMR